MKIKRMTNYLLTSLITFHHLILYIRDQYSLSSFSLLKCWSLRVGFGLEVKTWLGTPTAHYQSGLKSSLHSKFQLPADMHPRRQKLMNQVVGSLILIKWSSSSQLMPGPTFTNVNLWVKISRWEISALL